VIADAPATGERVAVEEHCCGLEDEGGGGI
jgi:hypothetical protein